MSSNRYFYVDGFRVKNKYHKESPHVQALHKRSIQEFIRNNDVSHLDKSRVVYTGGMSMSWVVDELWQEASQ